MSKNERATNQYYGKFFETAVVAQLNNSEVEYNENYEFSPEEITKMLGQAKKVADYLGDYSAEYIGNQTALASGDIKLNNGQIIELKRVSAGTGTYFNTSIYYFSKFGFDFKNYMEKYGLYEELEKHFGKEFRISRSNNSPVSQANSSSIRHKHKEQYDTYIVPVDEECRKHFLSDLADYFQNNTDKIYEFVSDMLNKNSETSQKTSPDRIIVYNYSKDVVSEINIDALKIDSSEIRTTDKGMVVGNIRVAIGWQNGNGLNNPTIRIFLQGE
jgi:hypothetical protein